MAEDAHTYRNKKRNLNSLMKAKTILSMVLAHLQAKVRMPLCTKYSPDVLSISGGETR